MIESKLKWNEPEIMDLSVKETKSGHTYSTDPDGAPWQDPDTGLWYDPHGKS